MLALFNNMFRRNHAGWARLTTLEGVTLLFPEQHTRACCVSESPFGPMRCAYYSARWESGNASSFLTVRDYYSETPIDAVTLFENWKQEFLAAIESSGIRRYLVKEKLTEGTNSRCDLLYSNKEETTFSRICLIAEGNRLIVLFTVGMLQEVVAPANDECFRSIRTQQ